MEGRSRGTGLARRAGPPAVTVGVESCEGGERRNVSREDRGVGRRALWVETRLSVLGNCMDPIFELAVGLKVPLSHVISGDLLGECRREESADGGGWCVPLANFRLKEEGEPEGGNVGSRVRDIQKPRDRCEEL